MISSSYALYRWLDLLNGDENRVLSKDSEHDSNDIRMHKEVTQETLKMVKVSQATNYRRNFLGKINYLYTFLRNIYKPSLPFSRIYWNFSR